ncbi:hypothetical protein [Synechococcus sp. MIT S1220]|uniref:hypothetical protein n=1 Tax=Synechococcus sp. MIT S1220 TaxID=3082549 RepID=UPI0039AF6235
MPHPRPPGPKQHATMERFQPVATARIPAVLRSGVPIPSRPPHHATPLNDRSGDSLQGVQSRWWWA